MKSWPIIDPGDLIHPIAIQQKVVDPTALTATGPSVAWQNFVECMAEIQHVRGTDVVRGGQITTQLYAAITIYYLAGIAPDMRVVAENGSTYIIQSVENELAMNIKLVLNCVALGSNDQ